jgi:uncharacterized protein (TIRG00374 family)
LPPGGSKPAEPEPGAASAEHLQNAGGGQTGAGRRTPAAAKAASIDAARSHPLTWRTVLNRALVIAVAGVAIYLVLPGLTEVLASWPRLSTLEPAWSAAAVAAEIASFTCYFALQRLALQTRSWFVVITAGLTGNSISGILPGGGAAGAAVQFEMLATAGFDPDTAVAGLTAFSLLNVGALLGLPILALPAMLAGAPASPGLVHTAFVGIAGFCLVAIFGAIILHTDRPLAVAGRAAEGLANWVTRGRRPPLTGLDTRLLADRDTIKSVLGKNWWQAVVLTTGRLGFDFCCLLAALRATGTHPRPSLVLLAYAAANVIALVPITPGGLGVVEASLGGLLILAGVHGGDAFLATLAYRLVSYWLPLSAGLPAYLLFRHRYGGAARRPARTHP